MDPAAVPHQAAVLNPAAVPHQAEMPREAYYVASSSRGLPISKGGGLSHGGMRRVLVAGVPVLLVRTLDGPRAFLDRCPHRGAPLSAGRWETSRRSGESCIECPYHGWRFDAEGRLREVPGLVGPELPSYHLARLPLIEESGLVFVCPRPGDAPRLLPYKPPLAGAPGYTTVVREVTAPGDVYMVAENALDVPHTSVLHRGLFRSEKRNRILAKVRRFSHWVETEYVGEPLPRGLLARILAVGRADQGARVQHWDRFFLPGTVQVEYRLGERTHFSITAYLTPETPERIRIFAVASFRSPLPGFLLALALEPVARAVFAQDRRMLGRLVENARAFSAVAGSAVAGSAVGDAPGPAAASGVSTQIDTMGPHIRHLLRLLGQARTDAPGPSSSSTPLAQSLRPSADEPGAPVFSAETELEA